MIFWPYPQENEHEILTLLLEFREPLTLYQELLGMQKPSDFSLCSLGKSQRIHKKNKQIKAYKLRSLSQSCAS